MDCDQVFAALTRGPFPTGSANDAEVENHLEGCVSCWRLAVALQPADEALHEAMPRAERRDLPSYWGGVAGAEARYAGAVQAANSDARLQGAAFTELPRKTVAGSPCASAPNVASASDPMDDFITTPPIVRWFSLAGAIALIIGIATILR